MIRTNHRAVCSLGASCPEAALGHRALARGRPSEAAKFYYQAAKKLPELADYFMLAKADAELKTRNFAEAKAIAQALLTSQAALSPGTFSSRINQVLAQIALAQKDYAQIIKTHEELLAKGFEEKEALLFNLAFALGRIGQAQKANEIYKQLLVSYPASKEAQKAETLVSLSKLELTHQENETRFNNLIQNLLFDKIVAESDQKLAQKDLRDAEQASLINSYAVKSLMLSNQFEKGIKRAQKQAQKKDATSKDLESYAWGLSKVNRYRDAAEYYGRLMLTAKSAEDKAKGCFFTGFSLYEASLYSMAQFAWQRCQELIKNTSYHEGFLWYQAFSATLNHDFALAQEKLKELKDTFKTSPQAEKYSYFIAYNLYQTGKKNAADAIFRELAKGQEPSYYVLQARDFLGLSEVKGVEMRSDALSNLAINTQNAELKKAFTLFHSGFFTDAKELILNAKVPNPEKLAALQHLGLFHEVWQRSYLLAPKAIISGSALSTKNNIRARYPLPHLPIISEKSQKYAVKQSLLYAVMQTESGFLHDAKSSRGATGLMQIMPFVAHDLAEKLDLAEFSADHLRKPEVAIELGAVLLATLKRQFEKNHLVVAAYNAGPHQVQKWLDDFGHLPPELFIERIPFEQTRNYVKKVLPAEGLYDALQGRPLRLVL